MGRIILAEYLNAKDICNTWIDHIFFLAHIYTKRGKKCHFAVLRSKMGFYKKSDLRLLLLESFHFPQK